MTLQMNEGRKLSQRKLPNGNGAQLDHPRLWRETVYIPVHRLSVLWLQAQRPFDADWARLIAENFDPDLFEDVVITLPNKAGIHHIIEGQHRVAAVDQKWGIAEPVPCRIINTTDPKRAAEIWSLINAGKKKARPVDQFKVKVTAQNYEAVSITGILKEHNLAIGNRAKGQVAAVSSLSSVYRMKVSNDGTVGEVLDVALGTMVRIWGVDNADAYCAAIIKAFGMMAKTYWDDADWNRLADATKKRFLNPLELISAGRMARERTLVRGICRELVYLYNYKKTGRRLNIEEL